MADHQQSGSSSGQNHSGQGGTQQKSQLSWGQSAPNSASGSQKAPQLSTPAGAPTASRTAGIFIAGLIVGLLIAWAWVDLRAPKTSGTSAMGSSSDQFTITQNSGGETASQENNSAQSGAQTETGSTPTAPAGVSLANASLTVPPRQDAGNEVAVTGITASQPVWAVVYEDDNGAPGVVLGAARFAASHSGTVSLLRSTLPGLTYFVGLVGDTPDHSYNVNVNAPILGSNGKQVMTQFTAQ
ncbi:MAG: hypothetical protein ACREGH_03610 [Minisyncoccia bacterium]